MKSIWISLQVAFSALGGFLGWYLGGVDGFLYALIAFVLVDYITGVVCAVADKKLSSAVGFKGICRKVLIFVLVGIGNLVASSCWWALATWWTCMCWVRRECSARR